MGLEIYVSIYELDKPMHASGNMGRVSELRVRHKQRSMQDEIKSYLELYCVIVVPLIVVHYYVAISDLLENGVWLTLG